MTISDQEYQELITFTESKPSDIHCSKFFPDEENPKICKGCKYPENTHVAITNASRWSLENTNWRKELNLVHQQTKLISSDIEFIDEVFGLQKYAQLANFVEDAHPNQFFDILFDEWKFQLPNLAISVVGDTRKPVFTSAEIQNFKDGLTKVVCATNSWVVTGGTLTGVDALVANCLSEYQILKWVGTSKYKFHLIGFVNWDSIDRKIQMTNYKSLANQLNIKDPFKYYVKRKARSTSPYRGPYISTLNPLYSHFLAIECGIKGIKHQELDARANFEKYLSSTGGIKSSQESMMGTVRQMAVPTVLLVIGGEARVVQHVAVSLRNGIPIILFEGSGGAADVIITAITMCNPMSDALTPQQKEELQLILDQLSAPNGKEPGNLFPIETIEGAAVMPWLEMCVMYKKHATVFNLQTNGDDLDNCLLSSLLSGATARHQDSVSLALRWNRCDDFIREVLEKEGDLNFRANINSLVTQALLENKLDFIRLFVDAGFSVNRWLSPQKLADLYTYSVHNVPTLEVLLKLSNPDSGSRYSLEHVYNICHQFVMVKPQLIYVIAPCGCRKINHCPDISCSHAKDFSDPFRELFIWSVLSCRPKAARFFFPFCKSPLMLSLLATKLWRANVSALHTNGSNLQNLLNQEEEHYQKVAYDFLTKSWHLNQKLTKGQFTH